MKNSQYPQDRTDDEAELGFCPLVIPSILERDKFAGMLGISSPHPFLIGKVLSSSDVLIKTTGIRGEIVYAHRRYGRFGGFDAQPQWLPIGKLVRDAAIYLQELDVGALEPSVREGFQFTALPFPHSIPKI